MTSLTSIEVSVNGKWMSVPALELDGKHIIVRGKFVKRAIIEAEEWLETDVQNPGLYLRQLRQPSNAGHSLRADIFTFTQKPPEITVRHQYPMSFDSVAILRIPSFKDWWDRLPQEGRKNVRRSQKRGVVVTAKQLDDDLIQGVVELNNDSPVRQGKPYAHYGKTFDQVRKDQSTFLDRCEFICAYCDTELVGFMKLVYRGNVASILQMLPKASHHDKRPANALLAKAVEVCESRGVSHLTYGLFNYGNKRDSPLREFKERNGFEEILVPRYYVPLTIKGKLIVKANLHRGLLSVVPPGLIELGVALRSKWYNGMVRVRESNKPV